MKTKPPAGEIKNFLKDLVAFESTQHQPQVLNDAFEYVCKYLRNNNLHIKIFESNGKKSLVASFDKNFSHHKVILNGHIDVVDAKKEDYVLKQKGDKLIGRGTADMKGPLAVILKLFADLAKRKEKPDCALMIVTDEEIGGLNGTKYVRDQKVTTDFFVACEPSDEKIIVEAKGVIWMKLTARSKSGHAARPWFYLSPIVKLINALQQYPEVLREKFKVNDWITTYNLTYLHAGKDINQVPSTAEAILDIRYVGKDNPHKIVDSFKKNKKFETEVLMFEPAAFCQNNNVYVKKMLQASKKKIPVERQPGASDARFYSQTGTNSIVFGPIGGGYHSENEWVSLKSLLNYYQVLDKFLSTL